MSNTTKLLFSLGISIVGISVLAALSIQKDHQYHVYRKQTEMRIDSLKSEIYVKDITIGTYEVMWTSIGNLHPEIVEEIENQVE